jgi:hypothetical protein
MQNKSRLDALSIDFLHRRLVEQRNKSSCLVGQILHVEKCVLPDARGIK